MSISASTYKKIQSIKTWATNKLPTITENSYTELLTDLLKYLDSLITNNDFFETDIQKIITELNKLLDKSFPTQDDITQAITTAKKEITTGYTEAINSAKNDITSKYTTAISESAKTLKTNIDGVNSSLEQAKTNLEKNITSISSKVDTTMASHKKNIKDTITGAMENLANGGN